MAKVQKECACGNLYMAREADLRRGWAKSCSKSCAAKRREKYPTKKVRTRQRKRKNERRRRGRDFDNYNPHPFSMEALGQWD